MTTPGIIVSGYSASPAYRDWDPDVEELYYEGLHALPGVRGLEVPWLRGIHPHDQQWMADHLRHDWDIVVTGVVAIWHADQADPTAGLASASEPGRRAAVELAREMAEGVARFNEIQGRRAVVAVQLHSAPFRPGADSSAVAFRRSLGELSEFDWHGARVLIEHADELRPGITARKGFLSIEDELAAVGDLDPDRFGVSINWGRSAIDLRDGDGVADQIAQARSAGLLRGVTFSGAAAVDNGLSEAWADTHLPLSSDLVGAHGEEHSLLTGARISAAARAMGTDVDFVGLKVAWRPDQPSVDTRVAVVGDNLAALTRTLGI